MRILAISNGEAPTDPPSVPGAQWLLQTSMTFREMWLIRLPCFPLNPLDMTSARKISSCDIGLSLHAKAGGPFINHCFAPHSLLIPQPFIVRKSKNALLQCPPLQGSAKEWSLGCVKLALAAGGAQDAGITQPRDHSLADPCTVLTNSLTKQVSILATMPVITSNCVYDRRGGLAKLWDKFWSQVLNLIVNLDHLPHLSITQFEVTRVVVVETATCFSTLVFLSPVSLGAKNWGIDYWLSEWRPVSRWWTVPQNINESWEDPKEYA